MRVRIAGKCGSYTLQCDVIKSDFFNGVRCRSPTHIDNAVSHKLELELKNWFTSTLRLMKSVQVKLQSSRLDTHFGELLLEFTFVCHCQLKSGGNLSYEAQDEGKNDLCDSYTVCVCLSYFQLKKVSWTEETEVKIQITLFISWGLLSLFENMHTREM